MQPQPNFATSSVCQGDVFFAVVAAVGFKATMDTKREGGNSLKHRETICSYRYLAVFFLEKTSLGLLQAFG